MQAKIQALFTSNVYADFMRFMLASLAVGITAAALLSSLVVALSSHVPNAAIVSNKHS